MSTRNDRVRRQKDTGSSSALSAGWGDANNSVTLTVGIHESGDTVSVRVTESVTRNGECESRELFSRTWKREA